MAYVLWRVFMKKYSRVRLGIYKAPVTPTGRHIRSFEDSSWKSIEDNHESQVHVDDIKPEELSRHSDERQSKTKRVKNYLKKCKKALAGSTSSTSQKQNGDRTSEQNNCAYWYVDDEEETDEHLVDNIGDDLVFSDCEVFEKVGPNYVHNKDVNVSEETLVDNSAIENEVCSEIIEEKEKTEEIENREEEKEMLTDSLPTLVDQDVVEESKEDVEERQKNENEVTEEERLSIADRTVGQFDNPEYTVYKTNRLTASLFGNVVRRQDHTPCDALVKQILKDPNATGRETEAIKYGKRHESTAIKMFESLKEKEAVKVSNCGLFIDSANSFLGASPDGITNTDALIEVKCLYSLATKRMNVHEACNDAVMKNKICLKMDSNGIIQLKRTHNYYYQCKGDVASLVDRLMGPLYPNYANTRPVLVRQARDLLVCEYLGNLARFEQEFCIPAAQLIQNVKEHVEKQCPSDSWAPAGWPLCVGPAGVVLHLGPLAAGLVRARECYLCVRGRSAAGLELALVARRGARLSTTTLADLQHGVAHDVRDMACVEDVYVSSAVSDTLDSDCDTNLPELLQNLLVSVEHAIQRVPLDDLAVPCPHCLQLQPLLDRDRDSGRPDAAVCACQCQCPLQEPLVVKKDSGIQTSPMFEFAGAIPHIDSDEDDDKEAWRSQGSLKRSVEITVPKTISDVPEKLLMSGINLPGTHDRSGRPIVLCDAPCVNRAGLNKYEVATLLLYYASIPSKQRIEKGFTILVLAETSEETTLDLLDKAFVLLTTQVKISSVLIWRPGAKKSDCPALSNSKLKPIVIPSETTLHAHISMEQAPASCGGSGTHDQLEWVEFFRELEPFVEQCRTVGRALLGALAVIRDQEMPSMQLVRRFLHHQQRQLQRALADPTLTSLRRTGSTRLESLTERAQWLTGSEDVRRRGLHARHSFHVAERVSRRLESLAAERRQALEELARLRALEDEANEISLWLQTEGNENLKNHCNQLSRVADGSEVRQQNQEFEKFYFIAMRQIDKAGDLFESSNHCQGPKAKKFKDTTQQLKQEISAFSDQLEDIRQRLEDTSRCFDLLARCQSSPEESKTDVLSELNCMAAKSGNEKLIEKCQEINNTTPSEPSPPSRIPAPSEGATSTPIKPPTGQHRRRSVSSFAFIYKCNHHAAGVPCDCWESELEENTESAKLKKKYVQSLQTCGCSKSTIDRKSSLGLEHIKEVRESTEDLLVTSEKTDSTSERNDSGVSGCGRCDSGLSTGNVSVCQSQSGDDVFKKRLQRTCSCQYCNETGIACSGGSSSGGSHGDHTERQYGIEEGDVFPKSTVSEELEETDEQYNNERNKTIPPIAVNSHLHCRSSNLDLPSIQDQSLDSKTQKTLLLIMREMIQTERDYVRSLYYVIENYIPELLREDIPQALRGQRNVVFGNIEKIYEFHSQQFLGELEMCENSPRHVGQIFLRHKNRFSLYALYNKNKPKSDSLMTEYGRTFFKSKQIQLKDNLDLASYLLKPVQRMGKYALLLQQLMKACPELPEGSSERAIAERDDLISAEEMVKFQLRHGNDLLAMDSIRECDVNLKEQGRLLRQNEFLVSEGRGAKKSLRQVFLFEELILFSKARRFPDRKNLDLYIYKNSIKMTDIGLTAKIGDCPTKFEIWFRKRKPNDTFTLQATSEDVKKLWAEELSKLLWKQAMRNREIRLQEMSSMGIGNKPCLDIRPSADNINDRSISIAQLKTAPRFRNSIVGPVSELCRSNNRPHSIISVSSVSSGSTSSAGSGGTIGRHLPAATGLPSLPGMQFDAGDSPHSHHSHSRSHTLNSQCSMESGIIADISIGSDDCPESQLSNSTCWPLQKSNSQNSNNSTKYPTTTSNSSQTDDMQLTLFHVPDDVPINI